MPLFSCPGRDTISCSLSLTYRWHILIKMIFLRVTLSLLCPQRKKLIRNNTVFKKLAIEGNEKLLEKNARGKMPRRNKKYHCIGRAGWHLSERHLPLHANGRMEMGFICTWFLSANPQTMMGRIQEIDSRHQMLRTSRKRVSVFVWLNNWSSYITHFNFIQVVVSRGKKCVFYIFERWATGIVSLGKSFLWSREKETQTMCCIRKLPGGTLCGLQAHGRPV